MALTFGKYEVNMRKLWQKDGHTGCVLWHCKYIQNATNEWNILKSEFSLTVRVIIHSLENLNLSTNDAKAFPILLPALFILNYARSAIYP